MKFFALKFKKQKLCFGLIKIRERKFSRIFYIFSCPVFRIKYSTHRIKYYLFSFLPIYFRPKTDDFCLSFRFKTDNFKMQHYDDSQLLDELKKMEPFTYIPNPGNMGDVLIAAGTLLFFEKHHLKYKMFDGDFKGRVVFGGGGGIVPYYKKFWRKLLCDTQSSDKILILPSSIWNVPEFVKGLDERFTIFARDKVSYQYLLDAKTSAAVLLDHDMALRLTSDIFKKTVKFSGMEFGVLQSLYVKMKPLKQVAYMMRQDIESTQNYASDLDLSSCFRLDNRALPDWIYFGAQMMLATVDRLDAIVTDRLHVGIAGVLMGKQVYWLDNSYHKIRDVYKNSLSHVKNVHLCESVPSKCSIKAPKTAKNTLEQMLRHVKRVD